jgi:flagellar biosynthesis chaperone FliJ
MPQFERFIENLIEMRSHYGAQIQKYDLAVAQAQDSLSHLNALLVDETHNNQQFIQTLIQMRSHYQNLVDESHRHSASAKNQLNHINALLAEQLVIQHSEYEAISMQARTVEERQTLAITSATQHQQLPQVATPSLRKESNLDSLSPENIDLGINQDSLSNAPTLKEGTVQSKAEPTENVPQLEQKQPQAPSTKVKKQLKTPLLPQYEHLSKSEAVEKLLQDDIGHILHIEYIIRSLYGELDPESVRAEKTRLDDTLLKGVEKGLWDKVPDQPGCYTIDLKLVELETDVKPILFG